LGMYGTWVSRLPSLIDCWDWTLAV
jgi:hypothetical protein